MGTPFDHLPKPYSDEEITAFLQSISSPTPTGIRLLKTSAEFHIIYVLSYDTQELLQWFSAQHLNLSPQRRSELILRICGSHIASIKTENEAAVLHSLKANTTIPVPVVIKFDATEANLLGREYMIMTREPGECLADVYQDFTDQQMDSILGDIIDAQRQLHSQSWNHVGGLKFHGSDVVPGPVLDEDMWFIPDIEKHWPGERYETLNLSTSVHSYVEYIIGHMRNYVHCIEIHSSLTFMRDTLSTITQFMDVVEANADILNNIPLRMAHKDLHCGNILVDTQTARVTSILDWEFAGCVPFTMWDPHNAFLAIGHTPTAQADRQRFRDRYHQMAQDRGLAYLMDDAKFTSNLQRDMQEAQTYCRSIVEVCPRGQRQELVPSWKNTMLRAMASVITQGSTRNDTTS